MGDVPRDVVMLLVDVAIEHRHVRGDRERFRPSANWAHAGPIIERESVALLSADPGHCVAAIGADWVKGQYVRCRVMRAGPTHLIAAMRVYVASKE